MKSSFAVHFFMGIFGLLMGGIMVYTGFSNFSEVHNMFVFADFRLLFGFAGSVAIAMIGFAIFKNGYPKVKRKFNSGTIQGGTMFGVGWAITGACPTIALVQIGQGQLAALFTVSGILAGVWIYRRLSTGSVNLGNEICGED